MASFLSDIQTFINYNADPRTKDYPFVESPTPLLIIIVSYLYFVIKVGPDYMRERKPYDLKLIISIYNIGQVISCALLFAQLLDAGWLNDYSLLCQPTDESYSPKALQMTRVCWWTLILKLSEFLETVFFVLRKKQNQISTLHLYHHVSTLSLAWICVKYSPGGMTTFPIMPNCLVHIIMYSYYLASLHAGKGLQLKLNKWKRYLTIIQMVQFCVMLAHAAQSLAPSCKVKPVVIWSFIPNVALVFYLFYQFYQKSYNKQKVNVNGKKGL